MSKLFQISATLFLFLCAATTALADQTIKQRVKMQGQTMETTVRIKGARQRTETSMGGEAGRFMPKVATVTQCDLRRNLQINDQKRLYFIEPFAEEVADGAAPSDVKTPTGPRTPAQRGGIVTMTYIVTDTGERKEMFGLSARRIKTMMSSQPSPDACQKEPMRMETDGWYVDLAGFSCPIGGSPMAAMPQGATGGCRDRIRYKTSGSSAKLGFPLHLTTTMFDANGKVQMTMTTETIELSSSILDAALFDIPVGYLQAGSSEDLYKMDPASMMAQMMNDDDEDDNRAAVKTGTGKNTTTGVGEKRPGVVRIGVLSPSNKSAEDVSIDQLRGVLIENLSSGSVEAVAVSSVEEAKAKACDFVLHTDITRLKQSAANKIGGMFGKVTGVEATKEKFEAQIDYRLVSTASGQTSAQNKVVQKSEGSAEQVAETALAQTARAVAAAVKK